MSYTIIDEKLNKAIFYDPLSDIKNAFIFLRKSDNFNQFLAQYRLIRTSKFHVVKFDLLWIIFIFEKNNKGSILEDFRYFKDYFKYVLLERYNRHDMNEQIRYYDPSDYDVDIWLNDQLFYKICKYLGGCHENFDAILEILYLGEINWDIFNQRTINNLASFAISVCSTYRYCSLSCITYEDMDEDYITTKNTTNAIIKHSDKIIEFMKNSFRKLKNNELSKNMLHKTYILILLYDNLSYEKNETIDMLRYLLKIKDMDNLDKDIYRNGSKIAFSIEELKRFENKIIEKITNMPLDLMNISNNNVSNLSKISSKKAIAEYVKNYQ